MNHEHARCSRAKTQVQTVGPSTASPESFRCEVRCAKPRSREKRALSKSSGSAYLKRPEKPEAVEQKKGCQAFMTDDRQPKASKNCLFSIKIDTAFFEQAASVAAFVKWLLIRPEVESRLKGVGFSLLIYRRQLPVIKALSGSAG
jgi:hypothetical protein